MKERFGEYLRKIREEKGIPLRKVASFLDIDQSTLSKFERSERLPKESILPRIAIFFSLDIDDLRLYYFSDKILELILTEKDPRAILEATKEKLRHIKSKNYQQGKLDL